MTNSPIKPNNSGAHSKGNDGSAYRKGAVVPDSVDSIEPAADLPEQEVIRVRKRRKKKMSTKKRVVLTIVLAILAALLIGGIAFAVSVNQAAKNATDYSDADISSPENTVSYSSGKTVEHNGHTYQLNENIVSIVFMGVDKTNLDNNSGNAPGQADAIMVVALDTTTGKVNIIAVPRDSMVDVSTSGPQGSYAGVAKMQLCLAYNYGNSDATCAQNVVNSVQRTLYNMPMKYYFALDEGGIGPMCDSIDGVSLTALDTIPGTQIVQGQNVILFGDNALRYVQYRDTTQLDSPLNRLARQEQFVRAFAQQALSQAKGNVGNLLNLYNTVLDYSDTNLGTSDFTYLATNVAGNGVSDVQMHSLDGTMVQGEKYGEYNLNSESVYQSVLDVYYNKVS